MDPSPAAAATACRRVRPVSPKSEEAGDPPRQVRRWVPFQANQAAWAAREECEPDSALFEGIHDHLTSDGLHQTARRCRVATWARSQA
jgi:hypothetical protein